MASGSVYTVIRNFLTANWSATPLVWENEPYNPPATGVWAYIDLTGTLYEQKSLGAADDGTALNRWDEEGIIIVSFHAPKNSGTKAMRDHMENFANLFRGLILDSGKLEFERVSLGQGRPGDDEGRWYQIPVTIDWRKIDA